MKLNLKGFNTSCAYNQTKYNEVESTRRNGILFQDLEKCQRRYGKCRYKIINTGWQAEMVRLQYAQRAIFVY